jgi:hypothetical protein
MSIRLKKRKYLIKANKKRCRFEKILKKLGHIDRIPIQNKFEFIYFPILECYHSNGLIITGFYKVYQNKKSYLYEFYLINQKTMRYKKLYKNMKLISDEIIYKEKGRMCEIGWRIDNSIRLINLTQQQKVKLYINVLRFAKIILKYGNEHYTPRPNDIVLSKPDQIQRMPMPLKKFNKRGKINEKIGFGKIKQSGSQYAKYDANLTLTVL